MNKKLYFAPEMEAIVVELEGQILDGSPIPDEGGEATILDPIEGSGYVDPDLQ